MHDRESLARRSEVLAKLADQLRSQLDFERRANRELRQLSDVQPFERHLRAWAARPRWRRSVLPVFLTALAGAVIVVCVSASPASPAAYARPLLPSASPAPAARAEEASAIFVIHCSE